MKADAEAERAPETLRPVVIPLPTAGAASVRPEGGTEPKKKGGRSKGSKTRATPAPRPPKPSAMLPGEPSEPQGRAWRVEFRRLDEVADRSGKTLREQIYMLIRNAVPPEIAAQSFGIPRSVWKHWLDLARRAVMEWGYEGAIATERYAPLVRLLDDVARAQAERTASLVLLYRAGAQKDPRTAAQLLREVEPEYFAPRKLEADDAPAAGIPLPASTEASPIRVFMPDEQPLLMTAAPTAVSSSSSSPPPASGRSTRGPRLVIEDEPMVIEAEGREVG